MICLLIYLMKKIMEDTSFRKAAGLIVGKSKTYWIILKMCIRDRHIMCVLYTEEIGGVLTLEFDEDGSLQFQVEALEADAMFDEIGSVLRIKDLRQKKKELLESLELYYNCLLYTSSCHE